MYSKYNLLRQAGKHREFLERQMQQNNVEHSYYYLNAPLLSLAPYFVYPFLNKFNMSDNNSDRIPQRQKKWR